MPPTAAYEPSPFERLYLQEPSAAAETEAQLVNLLSGRLSRLSNCGGLADHAPSLLKLRFDLAVQRDRFSLRHVAFVNVVRGAPIGDEDAQCVSRALGESVTVFAEAGRPFVGSYVGSYEAELPIGSGPAD